MPEKNPSTARLEAFSDGVIAVIITIMVLELKVPHADGLAGARAILPILLVYLLSFTFTGIYWINHQHLLDRVKSADQLILYANLIFLFVCRRAVCGIDAGDRLCFSSGALGSSPQVAADRWSGGRGLGGEGQTSGEPAVISGCDPTGLRSPEHRHDRDCAGDAGLDRSEHGGPEEA
jgi:hypothetical protein